MRWEILPEYVLLILCEEYINAKDVVRASMTCKRWYRICQDNLLWKKLSIEYLYDTLDRMNWYMTYNELEYAKHKVSKELERKLLFYNYVSWKEEYIRLNYQLPLEKGQQLTIQNQNSIQTRDNPQKFTISNDGLKLIVFVKDEYSNNGLCYLYTRPSENESFQFNW